MSGVEISQLVASLTEISGLLDRLGVPGLIALVLSGPLLALLAVVGIEYHRGRKNQEAAEALRAENRAMLETYRSEAKELLETYRTETRVMLETYRADTQSILRELGDNQQEVSHYYRSNVELVKNYAQIAQNLQDVVVSNTRAVEHLNTMLRERRNHQ